MDFFGEIGGIVEIVFLLGFLLSVAFVTRSMNSEMIKDVYQVQRYTRDSTQYQEMGSQKLSIRTSERKFS